MAEFGRIFINEWIKLIRRKRFLVVLLLGLALIAFYTFSVKRDYDRMQVYSSPEYQKQMLQQHIQTQQEQLDTMLAQPEDEKNKMIARIDDMKMGIESMKKELEHFDQDHAANAVFDEARQRQALGELKGRLQALPVDQANQRGYFELEIKYAEYRLDHKLAPDNGQFHGSSWQAIKQFLDFGSQTFIPLLCVLLVADMVSGEQTGGTIKLLLSRPPSRGKLLLGKYAASVTGALAVNVILLGTLCAAVFLLMGTAGAANPTAVGVNYTQETVVQSGAIMNTTVTDSANATILSALSFTMQSLLLTLVATVAMVTLGFFCSVLVRSAAVSTGMAMAIIIIGTIVSHAAEGNEWLKFFVTPHFGLPFAWSGELSQQFHVPMSLSFSLLVLFVWTVVLYAAGHQLFKRRDVLG